MSYFLGLQSEHKLIGVHVKLQRVVRLAIEITAQDFTVAEGLRTKERQMELYAQGRTRPGRIVTDTLRSKHIDGLAVDLYPYPFKGWEHYNKDPLEFTLISNAMFAASESLNTPIRWGADWNRNGTPREKGEYDNPHFELFGVA